MDKCLTCKHWGGDKAMQRDYIEKAEVGEKCLDLRDGWPLCGVCKLSHLWLELSVHGDAVAYAEVAAGFGCVLHEVG